MQTELIERKLNRFLMALWFIGIMGLSFLSGHTLMPEGGDMNYEIATMLTPFGLIHNLFWDPSHYLHSYYFQVVQKRTVMLDHPYLALIDLVVISSAALILWRMRSWKN